MGTTITLETKRTYLRQLTIGDAEDFYSLNLDPEVMKYTGDNPFKSLAEARDFLEKYDQYQKYGVGRLAVIEKKTGEFLGWTGLKYSVDDDHYDLGFRLLRKYWNRGIATETALACLDFGFHQRNLQEIVGRAYVENFASKRVIEKLGMTFSRYFDYEGKQAVRYAITRNEYFSKFQV